jgi:hypothetical protein
MKKIALIALAASAAIATPAAAQTSVTGTINLTGSVAAKCFVSPGSGTTFGETVAFGELAQADGTMRTDLATAFGTRSATVKCTTATPTISVDSTALATAAPSAAGYDNSIDFTASVAVVTTTPNAGPFVNDSANAALAATSIGSSLANSASNINITTSNYRTGALTDLLVASPTYAGSIVVVIAPN